MKTPRARNRGRLWVFVIIGIADTSFVAALAKSPPPLPVAIQQIIDDDAAICRQLTGRRGKTGDMVRRLDANGDGLTDYLVFSGSYVCPGALSAFTPTATAGVLTYLFLGRADGQVQRIWSGDSWGPEITQQGRRTTITFQMTGIACGDDRGGEVSVADRYSCKLELRPDPKGRWGLRSGLPSN